MKKILSLFLSFLITVSFCACGGEDGTSSVSFENDSQAVIREDTSTEVSLSIESSQPENRGTYSETKSVQSNAESAPLPVISNPPIASIQVEKYIVNDPENTRGLSNAKSNFSFGVAMDGKPHNISVNNQAKFDSMNNVEALALDTVSADKRMYLTFDCGYEYKNLTGNILDTLKEKNVKAAFFVTLEYIKTSPQFVRRMIDEGHIVGNHSAMHPVFPNISRVKMAEELYLVDEYLQTDFGYTSRYFRFPTGAYSENCLELVTSLGYKSIFWSIAYADYDTAKQMGYDKALQTVTARFHPGAVILLHAISQDNADILSAVIDTAYGQGYTFKTLDDYYR